MRILITTIFMCLVFFVGNKTVMATPTKGVQSVLLHRWSPASTGNLITVLRSYSGSEIEVAFAPNVAASASDPYRNIKNVIDSLQGQKRIYAVVYLNFHARDRSVNGLDKFQAFFNSYKDKAQIVVSPSLEDFTTASEINAAAITIATTIGGTNLSKLILRRSPDPTNNDKGKPSRSVSLNGQTFTFKSAELELHGVIENASTRDTTYIYSNDGVFVYDPNMTLFGTTKESANMFESINTSTKYNLSTFTSRTNAIRTNIWRPAYNMYRGCEGNYLPRSARNFKDCNDKAFDSEESNVLKRFLGISG